jgi:3-deoxy-D-manno-octulosonic-acid transferase
MCLSSDKGLKGAQQLLPPGAQVHVTGSIKFPHSYPPIEPEREAALRDWIEKRTNGAPLLVAGSTHRTEEAFVLDAFERVRSEQLTGGVAPVLLIAPRHVNRGDDVAELIRERGLRFSRRSQSHLEPNPPEACDVLLLDTLGELATAYRFGIGSFVGGTVYGDSHNVAEPLVWMIPVAYGPRRGNFHNEQRICEEAGVGFRISSPEELASHWTQLLNSPEWRQELAEKIRVLVESQRYAFERVLKVLLNAVDVAKANERGTKAE